MTTKTTTVETDYARVFTVTDEGYEFNLAVRDTDLRVSVFSHLSNEQAKQLADALLGENATVITDLPEAKVDDSFNHAKTVIRSGGVIKYITSDPAKLVEDAKERLAIAAFITKHNEEQEEAKKAEAEAEAEAVKAKEAARDKRRDELVAELAGYAAKYESATELSQKAIDRIIKLEEEATV